MELTLKGTIYDLHFRMTRRSMKEYSRGDHGMGGGEYTVYYGAGDVSVRDKSGTCVAACNLGYDEWDRNHNRQTANDEAFARCIEVPGLLNHKRQEYTDWLADLWIKRFRENRKPGIPGFQLEAPAAQELIQLGFMLNEEGQAALSLESTQ